MVYLLYTEKTLDPRQVCAHCKEPISKYKPYKTVSGIKLGEFKVTTNNVLCPNCLVIYKEASAYITPGHFPEWFNKFTSSDKQERLESEREVVSCKGNGVIIAEDGCIGMKSEDMSGASLAG